MNSGDRINALRTVVRNVRKEVEKDGYDLVEQVVVLTLGGVLGGHALTITQADYGLFWQVVLYLLLLTIGLVVLGIVHFLVSYYRINQE